MFLYLLAIALVLLFIHVLFNYNKRARALRKIPGFRDDFIIGNALELWLPPGNITRNRVLFLPVTL